MSRGAPRPPAVPATTSSSSSHPSVRMAGPGPWGAPAPRRPLPTAPLPAPRAPPPPTAPASCSDPGHPGPSAVPGDRPGVGPPHSRSRSRTDPRTASAPRTVRRPAGTGGGPMARAQDRTPRWGNRPSPGTPDGRRGRVKRCLYCSRRNKFPLAAGERAAGTGLGTEHPPPPPSFFQRRSGPSPGHGVPRGIPGVPALRRSRSLCGNKAAPARDSTSAPGPCGTSHGWGPAWGTLQHPSCRRSRHAQPSPAPL